MTRSASLHAELDALLGDAILAEAELAEVRARAESPPEHG